MLSFVFHISCTLGVRIPKFKVLNIHIGVTLSCHVYLEDDIFTSLEATVRRIGLLIAAMRRCLPRAGSAEYGRLATAFDDICTGAAEDRKIHAGVRTVTVAC